MSQKTGSLTYQTFAAGLSLVVYALFVAACDLGGLAIGAFRTLGGNPLLAYLLHPLACLAVQLAVALAACAATVVATWAVLVVLERRGLYLRL